jgi:hypothetical protein
MRIDNLNTRMDTKMLVDALFDDKIVSRIEIDALRRGDKTPIRTYNEIICSLNYPTEHIDKLMSEGKVDDAQQEYFKYINKSREGLIRL